MSVDVIIPVHNNVQWLEDCVSSVLAQTYPNVRAIVVDDGSSPSIAERCSSGPFFLDRRVLLLAKQNGGASSARNLGLKHADADYVLLLDSDDILLPSAIELLLSLLEQSGAQAAAGSWSSFLDGDEVGLDFRPIADFKDAYANFAKQGWVAGSVLLSNDRTMRFNERRMPWETLEYYLDYLASGRDVAYVDQVVVKIRQHDSASRLTHLFDHFEPFNTGSFFAEKKRELVDQGLLNLERAAALDFRILSSVHSLLRLNRQSEAQQLFNAIDWGLSDQYEWIRFGSFAWFSRRLGFSIGAKGFIQANKLIGRA